MIEVQDDIRTLRPGDLTWAFWSNRVFKEYRTLEGCLSAPLDKIDFDDISIVIAVAEFCSYSLFPYTVGWVGHEVLVRVVM